MKLFNKIAVLFTIFLLTALQGSSEYSYEYYAVYMDRANLEKSVVYTETDREMKNPGKIYYKAPYLFINEKYKGVHIIDNSDPENPVQKGFIVAPGCLDMAVKDDIIYLDNAVDLVSFDLTAKKEVSRNVDVFPELAAPSTNVRYDYDRPDNLIIVEWVKR
jgi:glutaredoxin